MPYILLKRLAALVATKILGRNGSLLFLYRNLNSNSWTLIILEYNPSIDVAY